MVALADRRCAVDRQSAVALGDRWCIVALVDHRRAVCGRRTSGYGHAFRPLCDLLPFHVRATDDVDVGDRQRRRLRVGVVRNVECCRKNPTTLNECPI